MTRILTSLHAYLETTAVMVNFSTRLQNSYLQEGNEKAEVQAVQLILNFIFHLKKVPIIEGVLLFSVPLEIVNIWNDSRRC